MPSRQGIQGAQANGTTPFTFGLVNLFAYAGDPSGNVTALHIGDMCMDYTNGVLYIATATGTGSWGAIGGLASSTTTFDVGTNLTVGGTAEITGTLTQTGVATFTAAPVMPTRTKIGGTEIRTYAGTPSNAGAAGSALAVPSRIGDIWIDYTNGKMYVAGAVSTMTDFKIVTSA